MDYFKGNIVICTYGSIGISVIRKLFALGIDSGQLTVITHDPHKIENKCLIYFLHHFNIPWEVVGKDMDKLCFILDKLDIGLLLNISYKFIYKNPVFDSNVMLINMHPGILPDYKGWLSVPWAMFNEETHVGYTYHIIEKDIDSGAIILIEKIPVLKTSTAFDLHFQLHYLAIEKLRYIIKGNWKAIMQDRKGNYYKKKLPNDGYIDRSWDDDKIDRFIRAMYFPPYAGALLRTDKGDEEIYSLEHYKLIINEQV